MKHNIREGTLGAVVEECWWRVQTGKEASEIMVKIKKHFRVT